MLKLVRSLGGSEEPEHKVPCRDCGTETTCSGSAWDLARTFNHQAKLNGWQLIGKNELVRCRECSRRWQAEQERAARAEHRRQKELARISEATAARRSRNDLKGAI